MIIALKSSNKHIKLQENLIVIDKEYNNSNNLLLKPFVRLTTAQNTTITVNTTRDLIALQYLIYYNLFLQIFFAEIELIN